MFKKYYLWKNNYRPPPILIIPSSKIYDVIILWRHTVLITTEYWFFNAGGACFLWFLSVFLDILQGLFSSKSPQAVNI